MGQPGHAAARGRADAARPSGDSSPHHANAARDAAGNAARRTPDNAAGVSAAAASALSADDTPRSWDTVQPSPAASAARREAVHPTGTDAPAAAWPQAAAQGQGQGQA